MAIVKKKICRISRLGVEFSPRRSRDSMSSDEDECQPRSSDSDEDIDDDFDDADSGAGSDDFDISELGEIGSEFCQIGDQKCSILYELYDLTDLSEVLSVDSWNNCLTEEERFNLAKYLPDTDQETYMRNLKELFSSSNFHFGSPLVKLFDMLKGGLCEPRIALYQQGLNFFQKRKHYHLLKKYQNSMVGSLIHIRDAWGNCKGYSIKEKLCVLNMRNRYEKMEDLELETVSSEKEESDEGFWAKRLKDVKLGSKLGRKTLHTVSPILDVSSQGTAVTLEHAKYGQSNPKGILKFAGLKAPSTKEILGPYPSIQHGLETKCRQYGSKLALPQQDHAVGYDLETAHQRSKIRGEDDARKANYGTTVQRNWNSARGSAVAKGGFLKRGVKHELEKRADDYETGSFLGLPSSLKNDSLHSHGRNRNVNLVDREVLAANQNCKKSSYDYHSRDFGNKAKHLDNLPQSAFNDQINTVKDRPQHLLLTDIRIDWSEGSQLIQPKKTKETISRDQPVRVDEWDVGSKKRKLGQEFQTGKSNIGSSRKGMSYTNMSPLMQDTFFPSDYRVKTSQLDIRSKSAKNGLDVEELRSASMFTQSEETESDSSEQVDEEDSTHPKSKFGNSNSILEGRQSAYVKSVTDSRKANNVEQRDKKDFALDRLTYSSRKEIGIGGRLVPEFKIYSSKGKQKDKIHDSTYLPKLANEERPHALKPVKSGQMQGEPGERMHVQSMKNYPEKRKQKGKDDNSYSVTQSNYMHDNISEEDDKLHATARLVDTHALANRLGKKDQNIEARVNDHRDRLNNPLLRCKAMTKKQKGKANVTYTEELDESDNLHLSPHQQIIDTSLKKRGKSSSSMVTSEPLFSKRGVADLEQETKTVKKPFMLITPTVHTGFSFSIIHLLSAVRMALITPLAEDASEVRRNLDKNDKRCKPMSEEQNEKHEDFNGMPSSYHGNMDADILKRTEQKNLPSLTIQEIVNRVRSNPGDPCILETQEPLQDLIRGVLKIFSSKTAPLGVKGWKTLVSYEKATKCWSWIGPISSKSLDPESVEEVTSSEAWDLPFKMLVKLVDSFANWLKSGQETLQQIGSLPTPPLTLMQLSLDEKERFRDLRAQKSLTTFSPSSEEVRAYFRREEILRYSFPDRAFSYTAADGKKSIVAPLRRCGGKPTSKARDHFMLKPDRPPHVTVLCLVRDAAARLPGSIGTRADVCTLIRDSQYIVEDVSDAQINQVVSGALDRLHYERDPCVQFDGERKLWVYLHREREEEDFEDDGTASTKKWKRQRKDATEHSEIGTVNVAYHGTGEQIAGGSTAGYDLGSDLNNEPSSPMHEGEAGEVGSIRHGRHWEVLGSSPLKENKILCQENSINEDHDDETYSRVRPFGLLT